MPGLPELGSDVSAFLLPPDCPVSPRWCQVCKPGLIAEGKGPLGVTLARWHSLRPPSNASQRCTSTGGCSLIACTYVLES